MIEIQKQRLLKQHQEQHRLLIKKYKTHFNPLLLPRLAVVGYHIRIDPSCQIFFTKIQLTDKKLVQKENEFMDFMKKVVIKQSQESHCKNQLLIIQWSSIMGSKTACQKGQFEETKHRYQQILTSRLQDLNELIFQIERFEKQPLLEKQCRQLLEMEIIRINQCSFGHKKGEQKTQTLSLQNSPPQDLALYQRKLFQGKQSQSNLKFCLQKRNAKISKRLFTELNPNSSSSFQNTYNQVRNTVIEDPIQFFQQDGPLKDEKSCFRKKQSEPGRYSMAQERLSKENNTVRNPSKKLERRNGGLVKTEGSWRINPRMVGKSVRYKNNQMTKTQTSQDKLQLPKNMPYSKLKSSKSIRFKDAPTSKMIPSSSQFSKNRAHSSRMPSKSTLKKSQEKDSNSNSQSSGKGVDLDENDSKFSSQSSRSKYDAGSSKKDYLVPKEMLKLNRRRHNKPKLSAFFLQDIENELNLMRMQKEGEKSQIKTLRREGTMLDNDPFNFNTTQHRLPLKTASFARGKRNGKILGCEANKHLERLLRQSNVEEMLIETETQQYPEVVRKRRKEGGKRFCNLTKKQVTFLNSKHVLSNKNKILMEVDLEAEHKQIEQLKNRYLDDYVDSKGRAVNPTDLKDIKEQFSKANPYHHKALVHYYGGDKIEQLDYEIITNEFGQYSFNRQFIKHFKKDNVDQYSPYQFQQCDPCDYLAFELGKKLTKECGDLSQKEIIKSSFLISQPEAVPLLLF